MRRRSKELFTLMGGLTPGVVDTATAIKVMGVGDSLTAGLPGNDYLAYRPGLLRRLGELGHAIQFVGATDRGEETSDGWTWDNKHNGSGGGDVETIDAYVPDGMRAGYPEIVILCAGVNDIPGTAEAAIVAEMETLIDEILTWPQVQYIFVTDTTLKDSYVTECENYNALLKTAVGGYGDNVIWVAAFATAELIDNVHPTPAAHVAIGEVLAEALAEVFPIPRIADNSPRQYHAGEGDFWLSTRNYDGTGLGPIFSDTAWSVPAEHDDNVATLNCLTLFHEFADSPTGPVYDDGSSAGVGPVLDFAPEGGVLLDFLPMGSPCTLFVVGEFDSGDASGYAIQFDTAGNTIAVLSSEVPGGTFGGLGFYDGTGGHKGFAAGGDGVDLNSFAVFAIRYQADGVARLYKNGAQIGNDVAYTDWGGFGDFVTIGQLTAQFRFADLVHIGADMSDGDFAALNAFLMTRNSIGGA